MSPPQGSRCCSPGDPRAPQGSSSSQWPLNRRINRQKAVKSIVQNQPEKTEQGRFAPPAGSSPSSLGAPGLRGLGLPAAGARSRDGAWSRGKVPEGFGSIWGGQGACRAGGRSASSQSKDCGYPGGKELGGPQPTKDISGPPQQHNQPRAWQDAALGTGEALGTTGGSVPGWNRSRQEEREEQGRGRMGAAHQRSRPPDALCWEQHQERLRC